MNLKIRAFAETPFPLAIVAVAEIVAAVAVAPEGRIVARWEVG